MLVEIGHTSERRLHAGPTLHCNLAVDACIVPYQQITDDKDKGGRSGLLLVGNHFHVALSLILPIEFPAFPCRQNRRLLFFPALPPSITDATMPS